jgi:hypothetical protein
MSQITATARALRDPRRAPSAAPHRVTPLRVIPTRMQTSGNGAFATVCVTLLTFGLIGLLLLNTALAEGSLTLGALKKESGQLTDRAGALGESITRASSSPALAAKATSLGMVRAGERGYIDLAKGVGKGSPQPATRQLSVPIVVAPAPAPQPVKRLTSAVDGASTALVKVSQAVGRRAATATPKVAATGVPPSATDRLSRTSGDPAPTPGTTR